MSYIESLSQAIAQADWDRLFPEKKDKPPPGEFELGLVLGGTVSAGAYTAGVLDFLIEALDNWETEKERNPGIVPNWKVTLKAISGTSGGGVLAAIMAKALSWKFPHVSSKPTTLANSNPFYHVWVESLDIKQMLSNTDIKSGRNLESLLNSECRFVAGEYVANFPAVPLAQKTRHYVAEPLPIFLTLTNLRGIPYCVDWGNGCKQSYVNHAHY
jgi:predicted acylesterase/phospholipase RssA